MKLPKNKFTLLAALWFCGGIYALLFKEGGSAPPPFPHFDKVGHFGLFFGQMWLCAKAYLSDGSGIPFRKLFVFALICALASEAAQGLLTATRQASFGDIAADLLGAAAALWFAWKVSTAKRGMRG